MIKKRFVIVGGVAAGMSAASRIKRMVPEAHVTVLEKGPYISTSTCGLPYFIADDEMNPDEMIALSVETAQNDRQLDIRVGCEVVGIICARKQLIYRQAVSGKEQTLDYDCLILATGARPVVPDIEGLDTSPWFTLRSLTDARKIKKHILDERPETVSIVGAGYVGIEMADAFSGMGLKTVIIEKNHFPLPGFSEDIQKEVVRILENKNIELRTGERVSSLDKGGLRTTTGHYSSGMTLFAAGVVPETGLAVQSGIRTGVTGGISVDTRMETSQSGIFAAGDCVETYNLITNRKMYNPLGTLANKQGRIAGTNAASGYLRFPGSLRSIELKVFDYEIARTGLSASEASEYGFEAVEVNVTVPSVARGVKERHPIFIIMTGDKKTGKILGAEMIGRQGVAQRINTVATAIINNNTAEEMAFFDFAYAPAFSPVWDPLLVAATVLSKKCSQY